jgi:long-subunit fatty acid transport protein
MMKKLLALTVLIAVSCTWAFAQGKIPERLLLSTGYNIGSGARALGLGGTYTGVADDYSSIWWNPAGLAQVKRIEIQGSLSRSGVSNSTNYYGTSQNGSTSAIRLNNAGIVFPVPVYKGAMSFAFGYNQLTSFDRRAVVQAPSAGSHFWDNFDELEGGRLGLWSFAGAMDVSPNLALGLGINYWTGADDYTLTGNYSDSSGHHYSEQSLNTDLSAWGINFGALFRAGRYARFGMMAQSPLSMSIHEEWAQGSSNGFFDYHMTYPWIFRVGASVCPGRWLLATDIEYRDWTSLEFRDDTPYSGVSRTQANQQIKDTYQSTLRFSIGGEYLFPVYGLRARAGYAFEPANYKGQPTDDRNLFTFGLGVLVDRSVMLDAALMLTSYKQSTSDGSLGIIKEDIKSKTALVTLSYRM